MMKVYGEHDEAVIRQLERCMMEDSPASLSADAHLGYSQPIGGAVAYENYISPSGVGYDIGCGNMAVRTGLRYDDVAPALSGLMDEICQRVSFGMGGSAVTRVHDHPVLDAIQDAQFSSQRQFYDLAAKQLGTVGAGNHYVDLFRDETDYVWVGVHFGSRGFGHKTASGFLALARGLRWGDKAPEGSMDAPPTLLNVHTELGQAYIAAMTLAGDYAYAGREVVVEEVLDILGAEAEVTVHNHHNYAWRETHFGRDYWVIRKGCTPARPGQQGFVGGSMGDISVILEGTDAPENAEGLYSTVHGAGRAMSRNEAAGKFRRRKRYACQHRDCTRLFEIDGISAHNPVPKRGVCPDHPEAAVKKIWISERKSEGKIDWEATLADLRGKGIVLRGGAADEAPGAYKRLPEVLEAHGDTIQILHTLTPIGVAMAGADTFDAYKD